MLETRRPWTTRLPALLCVTMASAACATAGSVRAPETNLPHAFDAGWREQTTCKVLYENINIRVGRCTFPPGIGHERHYHRPHFGYTLGGGTMRIEDARGVREVEIPAGTYWSSEEITVHEALNVGETTTSYLIVEPR